MARKPSIGLEIYFSEDIEMHLGPKLQVQLERHIAYYAF